MRKLAVWLPVVLLVVGAAAYYGLAVYPSHTLRAQLDQALAGLPPGVQVTYQSAEYAVATRSATLKGVTVKSTNGDGFTARVAGLTIKGLARDAVARWKAALADPAAWKPDQAIAVADEIAVTGIQIQVDGGTGGTDSLSLTGLRIYPWALLHAGVPSFGEAQAAFSRSLKTAQESQQLQQQMELLQDDLEDDPPDAAAAAKMTELQAQAKALQQRQFDELLPVLRLEAAAVLGIGFDGYDMEGVSFEAHPSVAGTAEPITLQVGVRRYAGGGMDRGVSGNYTMEGLTEAAGAAKIGVDRLTSSGVAVRDPATHLLEGGPLALATFNGLAVGRIEASGMTLDLPTNPIKIGSFSYSDIAIDQGFVKSAGFGMTGLIVHAADMPDAQSKAVYQQLGIDALTIGMKGSYAWQPDTATVTVRNASLTVAELGALTLSADLAGVKPEQPKPFADATLTAGTIRYDDASLIDRLLGMGGKRTPDQIKTIRQQFAAGIVKTLGQQKIDPRKLAPSLKAIADFATAPRDLILTLAPPAPVPLMNVQPTIMAGWPGMINVLGLSLAADQ